MTAGELDGYLRKPGLASARKHWDSVADPTQVKPSRELPTLVRASLDRYRYGYEFALCLRSLLYHQPRDSGGAEIDWTVRTRRIEKCIGKLP